MACNENIIKNMANEVTRNCQAQGVIVESEFVAYLIELLLLNPKYGKLFKKTLNRNNLAYFVEECVAMIIRGGTSLHILKMQFIMRTNYDKLQVLIDKHQDQVDTCLRPLVNEILDADPDLEDEAETKKLYRKISIYIILASGLGNPGVIMNLKEGMAALESVFSLDELKDLVALGRPERMARIEELLQLTSGVRLFNRDCKKGGEMIAELPFDLVDAGKACLSSLSNSLIAAMQRVNLLTTAVEDRVAIHEDTMVVILDVPAETDFSAASYQQVLDLLIFNRQYEVFIRRLLADVEVMVERSRELVDAYKYALGELHAAVKYKAAVPCDTVFPSFAKLWEIWRAMQNTMFLVSTVNRLMAVLNTIQEQNKIPAPILEKMLLGKTVVNDEERMGNFSGLQERVSAQLLDQDTDFSAAAMNDKHVAFLGFCTMSLNIGALIPSNLKIGFIKYRGDCYGFSSVKMASRFSKDAERYVNVVLQFARNNPHVINLLNMEEMVRRVRDCECLVDVHKPKKKLSEQEMQTEVHPIEEYIEHNYHWDLWEWKRRACQWATIVNCQTHGTQTNYSHLRSEIHSQTVEPRDKCMQTKRSLAMSTNTCQFYLWGLRGQIGGGQHSMDLVPKHSPEKAAPKPAARCSWPCADVDEDSSTLASTDTFTDSTSEPHMDFYKPD